MGKRKGTDWVKKYGRPGDQNYINVYLSIIESEAYLYLRPLEKCLLQEFLVVNYKTKSNGRLNLSVEATAKRLGVAKNTLMPAYRVLQDHGFIECTTGAFPQERLARLWRITFLPCNGREPTDEWRFWSAVEQYKV
jgi:hypothetical protein